MLKKIKIDREKCEGCGSCVSACHEGAIALVDGKAVLLHEDYCDGLGNCLPVCPAKAITFTKTHFKQWPLQIKLIPFNVSYFSDADLLVAADCTAFAYSDFHSGYMKNRVTVIGCPKLDECDYSEKLTVILKMNAIKSVTVARMEVPCCGGIENAVKTALINSGKPIPLQVVTFSVDGDVL